MRRLPGLEEPLWGLLARLSRMKGMDTYQELKEPNHSDSAEEMRDEGHDGTKEGEDRVEHGAKEQ